MANEFESAVGGTKGKCPNVTFYELPPLPLSKAGHDRIERQIGSNKDDREDSLTEHDSVEAILLKLKHEGNRSWVQLRKGCLDLAGRAVNNSTVNVGATSKAFARKATNATGYNYEQLLEWLDQNRK